MLLDDLLDRGHLDEMIVAGYVRARAHPSEPLTIFNYSEKAQYEAVWNAATRMCRGLIVHAATGEVLARPWRKFFNHGQPEAEALDLAAPVEVTDKLDGSLGILHPLPSRPGRFAIATRGSFDSEQATWATRHWTRRYQDGWTPGRGLTFLVEIIYPGNRIVLDYDGREDLVLLGAVDIRTGRPFGPHDPECRAWPGPRAEVFDHPTLGDALLAPPRSNAEGLVVRYLGDGPHAGAMVKIKQSDYVALHKLVTGLNARVVWERLGAGETVAQLCAALPDEFHAWVMDVAADLNGRRDDVLRHAQAEYGRILAALGAPLDARATDVDRRAFAELAVRSSARGWLFMLLDGKDVRPKIWHSIKPSADFAPRALPGEDAA